jgi:osmotically-inducible protein OsmY
MNEHADHLASSQISDEITHALHHSWFFDPLAITVTEEDGGFVTLSGTVASPHDRRRAAVAAWSHPGVVDVINEIEVAS